MTSEEVVIDIVEGALELAGVSEPVTSFIGGSLADLIEWLEGEFAAGRTPPPLKTLLTSADVAAKALENAELG